MLGTKRTDYIVGKQVSLWKATDIMCWKRANLISKEKYLSQRSNYKKEDIIWIKTRVSIFKLPPHYYAGPESGETLEGQRTQSSHSYFQWHSSRFDAFTNASWFMCQKPTKMVLKIVEMMEGEWGRGCLLNSIAVDPNNYNICVIFLRKKHVFIFLLKVLLNAPSDSYVKGLFMYLELISELAILCIM